MLFWKRQKNQGTPGTIPKSYYVLLCAELPGAWALSVCAVHCSHSIIRFAEMGVHSYATMDRVTVVSSRDRMLHHLTSTAIIKEEVTGTLKGRYIHLF